MKVHQFQVNSIHGLDSCIRIEGKLGYEKFGKFNSTHEMYAIIKGELDEFWESVKQNDPDPKELIQIAALARRAVCEMKGF